MVELTKNYSQQKKQTIKQIQTQNKLFPYWTSTILEWSRRLKRARVFTYSLFSCSADIYPVFVYTFQNQRSVNSMILLLRDFFIVLTFVVLVFFMQPTCELLRYDAWGQTSNDSSADSFYTESPLFYIDRICSSIKEQFDYTRTSEENTAALLYGNQSDIFSVAFNNALWLHLT